MIRMKQIKFVLKIHLQIEKTCTIENLPVIALNSFQDGMADNTLSKNILFLLVLLQFHGARRHNLANET